MKAPFLSRSEASPVRDFAISSLMVITLITVVLCVAISYLIRRELLEREWDTTAQFVRWEALENLKPGDFWNPNTPEARARFRAFYNDTIKMPEVVRVKVYDAKATVIWSDEPRLIGTEFPDN